MEKKKRKDLVEKAGTSAHRGAEAGGRNGRTSKTNCQLMSKSQKRREKGELQGHTREENTGIDAMGEMQKGDSLCWSPTRGEVNGHHSSSKRKGG